MKSFEDTAQHLAEKVKQIEANVWATEPSVLYLGGNKLLVDSINKQKKREGLPTVEFVRNFRVDLAKDRAYKGNRKVDKPLHYDNLRQWIVSNYECKVAIGCESDDVLGADLYKTHVSGSLDAICCSRDKDLKMIPGMHFGWECGRQSQFGPKRVTEAGSISLSSSRKKISGEGMAFFYSQMLTGDAVDNIPGCRGCGPVKAYETLINAEDMFQAVVNMYMDIYGEDWLKHYLENANLLWIVREFNEDGTPVMYQMPKHEELAFGKTEGKLDEV